MRGTIGEPLFFNDYISVEESNIKISNETRFCYYYSYFDRQGKMRDFGDDFYRTTNFFNIDYGFDTNVEIGARIPLIWTAVADGPSPLSNTGFGDILLRMRVAPFNSRTRSVQLALGAGVKFPTGEYESAEEYPSQQTLPTGTGSLDYSFMGYLGCDLKAFDIYFALGYVLTGETERLRYSGIIDRKQKYNLGDVISYDIALARTFTPVVSGIVQFNGYTMSPATTEDGSQMEMT